MADEVIPSEEYKGDVAEDKPNAPTAFSTDLIPSTNIVTPKLRSIGSDLLSAYEGLAEQSEAGRRLHGVNTGLKSWDMITSGFNPGQLYLIASRPGIGKTSLAFEVAFHTSIHEENLVALFTPGMSREDVVFRLISSEADINSLSIASGELSENEWMRFASAIDVIYNNRLLVDDSSSLNIEDILLRCEDIADLNLKLIVIDGLDLIEATSARTSYSEHLGQSAWRLKQVALALRVPVIVTCNVSRAVEQRGSRMPHLTDLPGEGRLEEVADGVFFLHRNFLDATSYISEGADVPIALVEPTELITAKNPNGPLGMTRIGFVAAFRKFVDWDEASDSATGF